MSTVEELLERIADDAGEPGGADDIFQRSLRGARVIRRRRRVRQGLAAVVVVSVVLAGVTFAVTRDRSPRHERIVTTSPSPQPTVPNGADAKGLIAGHWETLPPAPIAARSGAVVAWTGSKLFVWGGDELVADGATYDPATHAWQRLPAAPANMSPRHIATSLWTGRELLIWFERGYGTGLAFDPAANAWHEIRPLPFGADAIAVWSGDRALVFAGGRSDVASYDPAADRWETLPAPPRRLGHAIGWDVAVARGDGRSVIAWSHWDAPAALSSNSASLGGGTDILGYDERTRRWTPLQVAADVADVEEAFWTDEGVIVRGDTRTCGTCLGPGPLPENTMIYDPDTTTWSAPPRDPLTASGRLPANHLRSVWTGDALWSFDGSTSASGPGGSVQPGDASVYDATARRWHRLPRAPFGCFATPQWTGHEVLLYCDDDTSPHGLAWVAASQATPEHGLSACPALSGYAAFAASVRRQGHTPYLSAPVNVERPGVYTLVFGPLSATDTSRLRAGDVSGGLSMGTQPFRAAPELPTMRLEVVRGENFATVRLNVSDVTLPCSGFRAALQY
jgi:hypothetical protein